MVKKQVYWSVMVLLQILRLKPHMAILVLIHLRKVHFSCTMYVCMYFMYVPLFTFMYHAFSFIKMRLTMIDMKSCHPWLTLLTHLLADMSHTSGKTILLSSNIMLFVVAQEYDKCIILIQSKWDKGLHFGWCGFGWSAIEMLYERECNRVKEGKTRMVPRLKEVHVIRDSWTKLNVTAAKIMQVWITWS